ncbi:MAG: Outer membrane porin protein [Burkholderia plantarii]|nr:MAG: Outer membrane porin protein [Burkholderia plantarii]
MLSNKLALAAAVAGTLTASAHAQSSVTLYGSLDSSVAYVNKVGGKSLVAQVNGALSYNYWGLRGSEDLGGGNHAIFKLESGFSAGNGQLGGWLNTGSSQGLFNRQAYLGLSNDQYGTVTLGRQYDSVVDYLAPLSLAGKGVNLAAHPFNNDNIGAQYSVSNAVKYQSANYNGLRFGGDYSFSNSTNFAAGRQWSAGVAYDAGPLKVAAVYDQLNQNTAGALAGATTGDGESIPARTQRTFGVGANYTFGPATVDLLWTRTKYQGASIADGSLTNGDLRFDNVEASGVYGVSAALAIVGSYTFTYGRASQNGSSESLRWHSFALGGDYSFSKRTDAYLAGVFQHASGDVNAELGGTNIAGFLPASGTSSQLAVAIGLRHRF